LAQGLPADVIDVTSTSDHGRVAELLNEARLGFLVRAPHLVNEVAWPMKLGEYLAAGAPVVVSRCGWDAERLIEEHGAGLVIDWADPPDVSAAKIQMYLEQLGQDRPVGVEAAADALDATRWRVLLAGLLRDGDASLSKGGTG
jgi:hypothetical protein